MDAAVREFRPRDEPAIAAVIDAALAEDRLPGITRQDLQHGVLGYCAPARHLSVWLLSRRRRPRRLPRPCSSSTPAAWRWARSGRVLRRRSWSPG